MNNCVMLIGARMMAVSYIDAIVSEGYRPVVVDLESSLRVLNSEVDDVVVVPGDESKMWIDCCIGAAVRFDIVGVVPYGEEHVLAASIVAHMLGLKGPGLLAALASRDKGITRSLGKAVGLNQPDYRFIRNREDLLNCMVGEGSGRVVAKGLHGCGSDQVSLIDIESAAIVNWDFSDVSLIESYLPGPHYSSEVFVQSGEIHFINHTLKFTTGPPDFVETAHYVGASLPSGLSGSEFSHFARQIVRDFHVEDSIMHIEWIWCRGLPYLVEFALRTPGDFLMYGIRSVYGFDPFAVVVRCAVGTDLFEIVPGKQGLAVSLFPLGISDPEALQASIVSDDSLDVVKFGQWSPSPSSDCVQSSDDRGHHVLLAVADEDEAAQVRERVFDLYRLKEE